MPQGLFVDEMLPETELPYPVKKQIDQFPQWLDQQNYHEIPAAVQLQSEFYQIILKATGVENPLNYNLGRVILIEKLIDAVKAGKVKSLQEIQEVIGLLGSHVGPFGSSSAELEIAISKLNAEFKKMASKKNI